MRVFSIVLLAFVAAIPTAIQAQDNEPTSAPATTQPAATEWTLPQQDEIYLILPAGDKIYYLCADKVQEKAVPGGSPVRTRYATYMCFDTKAGSVSNVLLTIPGRFDPDKLAVFAFRVSPDGKYAAMDVNSAAGSNLAGLYMVDLEKKKARKFLPASENNQKVIWCGKELLVPIRDNKGQVLQAQRYSITGARVGVLPVFGFPWAGSQSGEAFVLTANPQALNKPLAPDDVMRTGKLLVVNKAGKQIAEVPVTVDRGYAVTYSPNLKFGTTQAANMNNAKKMAVGGMPLAATAFSVDGKTIIELPDPTKPIGAIWVSDTGQLLTKDVGTGEVIFWDTKGQKVWSVPGVSTVAVYGDKVYYIQTDNPKVIKTKPLEEKK